LKPGREDLVVEDVYLSLEIIPSQPSDMKRYSKQLKV
jgi:hypothetical protein